MIGSTVYTHFLASSYFSCSCFFSSFKNTFSAISTDEKMISIRSYLAVRSLFLVSSFTYFLSFYSKVVISSALTCSFLACFKVGFFWGMTLSSSLTCFPSSTFSFYLLTLNLSIYSFTLDPLRRNSSSKINRHKY